MYVRSIWKFSQVRGIEGQFVPREPKLVWVIGSFEKLRGREIGGEIVELEWSKSKGNKIWFEISGGSWNRGFEKSGFHRRTWLFLENGSQLGVFWPRRVLQVNSELSEKVQYSCNQAIKNGLNEAIQLMPINEALLSRQNFVLSSNQDLILYEGDSNF